MRVTLWAAILALAAGLPADATLVMFQWTPERILLAADSLVSRVHSSGAVERITECKIHQQGGIFFAIVGVNDDPGANVDLVSIAGAAAGSRNLQAVMHSFESAAAGPVRRLWEDLVRHRATAARLATETDGRMSLSIVFVSRRENAVAIKEYSGSSNGQVLENPPRFYGAGHGMRQDRGYIAVGIYADAQAAAGAGRQFGGLEGVSFVNAFFQTQIAREQDRLQYHGLPRIAGPVCVLEVMMGGAAWVNGYQGPCGPIKP